MSEKKVYQFDRSLLNTVLNPKHEVTIDRKKKMYRLVKGDSNLDMKEQSENAEPISFRVFNTLIPVEDATTQEWLESKPYFGSLINIYDPIAENKAKMAAVENNMAIMERVMKLENHELLGLGYQVFGKEALEKIKREEGNYDGLRIQLIAKANDDGAFIEEKLSKDNATFTFFGLAFAKEIIKEDEAGNAVYWGGDEGKKITPVTKGMTPLEAIVEYSTTPEGKTDKQMIGQRMEGKLTEKKVAAQKKEDAAKAADKKDEANDEK